MKYGLILESFFLLSFKSHLNEFLLLCKCLHYVKGCYIKTHEYNIHCLKF